MSSGFLVKLYPSLVFAELGQPGQLKPFTLVSFNSWIDGYQAQDGCNTREKNRDDQYQAEDADDNIGTNRLDCMEFHKRSIFVGLNQERYDSEDHANPGNPA